MTVEEYEKQSEGMWSNPDNFVFTNHFGKHLSPSTIYGNFKRIATKIGAPNARYHDLRHTFATISIQNGDDIKTISYNLGHATTSFTMDVYGHVSEKMKKRSSERMEEFIKGTLKGTDDKKEGSDNSEPLENKES